MNHFADRLAAAVKLAGNAVCVGLDPRWDNMPEPLRSSGRTSPAAIADAYVTFCHGVIDVVASVVPIVKVQAAFFEELGPSGMASMADVILYAEACGLLVIVDGKRNDIGSTAEAYARGYLGREGSLWHADALTVSPYLGDDSLAPFVQIANERGAGIFVLVKTSNPGGQFLQDLVCDGEAIYRRVAAHVEQLSKRPILANVDMARSAQLWEPPTQSSFSNFDKRCRTPGFLCPAMAAREAQQRVRLVRWMRMEWAR